MVAANPNNCPTIGLGHQPEIFVQVFEFVIFLGEPGLAYVHELIVRLGAPPGYIQPLVGHHRMVAFEEFRVHEPFRKERVGGIIPPFGGCLGVEVRHMVPAWLVEFPGENCQPVGK